MSKRILPVALTIAGCIAGYAQQTAATSALRYDVVSIREGHRSPGDPLVVGGGFDDAHSARLDLLNFTVIDMIGLAFGMDTKHVQGVPTMLQQSYFVVHARANEETGHILNSMTESQADTVRRGMLQAVLADRLHLRFHLVSRAAPAYILMAGKHPRLIPTAAPKQARTPDFEPSLPKLGVACDAHGCTLAVRGQSMSWLAEMMRAQLNGPVVDRTDISGLYDFTLKWSSQLDSVAQMDDESQSLTGALSSQLGLRIEKGKSPQTFLVVDHIEPPTPN